MVDSDGAVAVVGVAARVPGARDVEEYWLNLVRGREPVPVVLDDGCVGAECFDAEFFDTEFFGLTPRQAQAYDPRILLLLEIFHCAIENAGYDPSTLRDVGVFASAGPVHGAQWHWPAGGLDLRGPGIAGLTACPSALVGLHRAWQSLRAGECDVAVVGGAHLEPPHGQAACAVLVKRLADALADRDHISAVIRGIAGCDDHAGGANGAGVIERAVALAGLRLEDISYVEAYGTGTAPADQIEVATSSTPTGGWSTRYRRVDAASGRWWATWDTSGRSPGWPDSSRRCCRWIVSSYRRPSTSPPRTRARSRLRYRTGSRRGPAIRAARGARRSPRRPPADRPYTCSWRSRRRTRTGCTRRSRGWWCGPA